MGFLEWATSPWGQSIPVHIAWFLIWVSLIAGLLFLIVHAIYVMYFAKPRVFAADDSSAVSANVPKHVPRHSLVARMFHWIMAASMFTLLFTAFLPKVGIQFNWVTYHWIAGTVLTVSIVFHIIHASLWLDFWSIWTMPGKGCADFLECPRRRRESLPNIPWKTSSFTASFSCVVCR
jgi:hypothetical protein